MNKVSDWIKDKQARIGHLKCSNIILEDKDSRHLFYSNFEVIGVKKTDEDITEFIARSDYFKLLNLDDNIPSYTIHFKYKEDGYVRISKVIVVSSDAQRIPMEVS